MKRTQLNRGSARRLMYVEAKKGLIDGVPARIGRVTFSRVAIALDVDALEAYGPRRAGA